MVELRMPRRSTDMNEQAKQLVEHLLRLALIADEASAGVGIDDEADEFLHYAKRSFSAYLQDGGHNLCDEVWRDRAVVMPKQHTPQLGLTFRSLTHHLALLPRTDVTCHWTTYKRPRSRQRDVANLLLLPWPTTTTPKHFDVAEPECWAPESHGFFTYEAERDEKELERYVQSHLQTAEEAGLTLDVVVMPELAITWRGFRKVKGLVHAAGAALVAGVSVEPADEAASPEEMHGFPHATNVAAISLPMQQDRGGDETVDADAPALWLFQRKHHRWRLDEGQVVQYGLGGRLPAHRRLWERTALGPREVQVLKLDDWLTACPLICEDLARQDPVSSVIRAVGPNLVIALLMDGPQLARRWGARYAAVLADDPGSSVLTFTSLGMSTLSKPRENKPGRGRVIALWRDPVRGERELELPEGCSAAVLSLARHQGTEWSSDGRSDGGAAFTPTFASFTPFPEPPAIEV